MLFVSLIVYECLPPWIRSNTVVFILKGNANHSLCSQLFSPTQQLRKGIFVSYHKKTLVYHNLIVQNGHTPPPKPPAVAVNKTMSQRVAYYSLRITGQEFIDFCCLIPSLTYSRLGSARLIQSSIWGSHRRLISPLRCSFPSWQPSSTASLLSCLWRFSNRTGSLVM